MGTSSTTTPAAERSVEQQTELAFLPLHKRAFGLAAAFVSAVAVFGVTILHMVRAENEIPLHLLAEYLAGYSVTLTGALVGAFWAGVAGFVAGWFFAFCRNFALAVSAFLVRTRAELRQVREFLDHI